MGEIKIDFRFINIEYEIWGINEYLKILEDSLKYHKEQYPVKVKKQLIKKGYEVDDPEVDIEFQKVDSIVEDILPRTFRNSFIIILWSFYESSSKKICNYFYNETYTGKKIDNMKGNFPKRIQHYINKELDISVDIDSDQWEKIEKLYSLRNAFVHGHGQQKYVNKNEWNKILEWSKEEKGIDIKHGKILLSPNFIHDMYEMIKRHLSKLISKAKNYEINKSNNTS